MAQTREYGVYFMNNPRRTVLYIGVTNDPERRVAEHKSHALVGFTAQYNATNLVYCETFGRIDDAIAARSSSRAGCGERRRHWWKA